jgi:hypothetical protein
MITYLNNNGLIKTDISKKQVLVKRQWIDVDQIGLLHYAEQTGLVLTGEMIPRNDFENIMQQAENDREYAVKHGWLPK